MLHLKDIHGRRSHGSGDILHILLWYSIKKNTNRRGIGQKRKIKINLARFGKLIPTSNEANKVRQGDALLETFQKKKTVFIDNFYSQGIFLCKS